MDTQSPRSQRLVDSLQASPIIRRLDEHLQRRPTIKKLVRYSLASVVAVIVGQTVLVLSYGPLPWFAANLVSVMAGTIPNYLINRYWTWQQTGKNRLWGEIIPFWVMSVLGMILSFIAVGYADNRWGTTIAVQIAQLSGFGVVWIAKFLILDKVMWRIVHDLHPELDETGEPVA